MPRNAAPSSSSLIVIRRDALPILALLALRRQVVVLFVLVRFAAVGIGIRRIARGFIRPDVLVLVGAIVVTIAAGSTGPIALLASIPSLLLGYGQIEHDPTEGREVVPHLKKRIHVASRALVQKAHVRRPPTGGGNWRQLVVRTPPRLRHVRRRVVVHDRRPVLAGQSQRQRQRPRARRRHGLVNRTVHQCRPPQPRQPIRQTLVEPSAARRRRRKLRRQRRRRRRIVLLRAHVEDLDLHLGRPRVVDAPPQKVRLGMSLRDAPIHGIGHVRGEGGVQVLEFDDDEPPGDAHPAAAVDEEAVHHAGMTEGDLHGHVPL
mmetsp:Transcript_31998/g.95829  ORF Transcript_31998/g.95829 Transcript_31998/m.95829 type:complete len:318 (-) Transcript_31998:334-1287(-)